MISNFDYAFPPVDLSDYLRPLPMPPGGYPEGKCRRLCRKRAEKARWKKRVRARKRLSRVSKGALEVARRKAERNPGGGGLWRMAK